jgi:hypothetical protein
MDIVWNKPRYIPIPKPRLNIVTEYSSIRIASRLKNVITRLKVTALANTKIYNNFSIFNKLC